jgi:hypothetical protein
MKSRVVGAAGFTVAAIGLCFAPGSVVCTCAMWFVLGAGFGIALPPCLKLLWSEEPEELN